MRAPLARRPLGTALASARAPQVSGTLQQHRAEILSGLLDGRSAAVRREALTVVKMMLTQGLVHPMSCIPHVMALEVDVGARGTAEAAKALLRSVFERHQSHICAPGVVLDGLHAGHRLQAAPE